MTCLPLPRWRQRLIKTEDLRDGTWLYLSLRLTQVKEEIKIVWHLV